MRRFRFALALLFASCSTAGSIAAACDHCRNHQGCTCSCKQGCEDRGLLGAVDRFAGNLQAGIKQAIPKIELNAKFDLLGRTGDCDAAEDTCGCELKPATASCGCEQHQHQHQHQRQAPSPSLGRHAPIQESVEAPPMPIRQNIPAIGQNTPGGALPIPPKPLATPLQPRTDALKEDGSVPVSVPHGGSGEAAPDAMVDPFQDEDTARLNRSLPATPVTYRRPINRYVDSYDPQANSVYRVKLIDSGSDAEAAVPTASQVTTASAAEPVAVDARGVSSRRLRSSQTAASDSTSVRSGSLQHARSGEAPRPISSRPAASSESNYYKNPLR